jgi:guanosine-3',5'-bis(diphosphate) 3'-pyrophosphohydrolase
MAADARGADRHSGEPYFTHPVAVAAILTEQRLDDATIVTALLHDTIEDTKGTYSEIAEEFGTESPNWSTASRS